MEARLSNFVRKIGCFFLQTKHRHIFINAEVMGKYDCQCGKQGFVEVADCDNKYPCYECYHELIRKRNECNQREGGNSQGGFEAFPGHADADARKEDIQRKPRGVSKSR